MTLRIRERGRVMPAGRLSVDLAENTRHYLLYHDDRDVEVSDVDYVTQEELQAQVVAVLGRTLARPPDDPPTPGVAGPGSINRVMPWADPVFPDLFAEDVSVTEIDEEGFEAASNADPDYAVLPVQGHCNFKAYDLAVRYTQRPFAVFPNERLSRQSVEFFDPNNVGYRLYYYKEWLRYCRVTVKANDTRLSAQQGSAMQFRAPGVIDSPSGLAVDGIPFTGIPDMIVPDTSVGIEWFGVPARYLDSPDSFLLSQRGRINQLDFWRWKAGCLLYVAPEVVRRYTQITFTPSPTADVSDEELVGTFAADERLDLVLHCVATARQPGTTYSALMLAAISSNRNHVVAGHNLLPHFPTRKFWYATGAPFRGADPAKWIPSYFSFPFEMLFQDPDVPGNIIAI